MTLQSSDTSTEYIEDVEDASRYAHYADAASVTEGYILGKVIVAICGRVFIPTRDPLKLPICPICQELSEALFLDAEEK